MFEVASGMAINYCGNPRPYLFRCIIHQGMREMSNVFLPYFLVPVVVGRSKQQSDGLDALTLMQTC